jgi:Mg2+ and Co2+ transporter CorA
MDPRHKVLYNKCNRYLNILKLLDVPPWREDNKFVMRVYKIIKNKYKRFEQNGGNVFNESLRLFDPRQYYDIKMNELLDELSLALFLFELKHEMTYDNKHEPINEFKILSPIPSTSTPPIPSTSTLPIPSTPPMPSTPPIPSTSTLSIKDLEDRIALYEQKLNEGKSVDPGVAKLYDDIRKEIDYSNDAILRLNKMMKSYQQKLNTIEDVKDKYNFLHDNDKLIFKKNLDNVISDLSQFPTLKKQALEAAANRLNSWESLIMRPRIEDYNELFGAFWKTQRISLEHQNDYDGYERSIDKIFNSIDNLDLNIGQQIINYYNDARTILIQISQDFYTSEIKYIGITTKFQNANIIDNKTKLGTKLTSLDIKENNVKIGILDNKLQELYNVRDKIKQFIANENKKLDEYNIEINEYNKRNVHNTAASSNIIKIINDDIVRLNTHAQQYRNKYTRLTAEIESIIQSINIL